MDPLITIRVLIISILGEYSPTLGNDGEIIGGLASIDFTWIAGAVFFGIMLVGTICILRTMIRGLFNVR